MPSSSHRSPDAHGTPAASVDLHADGTVRAVHPATLRLLLANADLLQLTGGRLQATDAAALQKCLARAHAGQPSGLAMKRDARLPLTLRAMPEAGGAVRVTLRDPDDEQPDIRLLRELFALTPAEAQVAACLALGQRTADIAAGLGVQANTVQAHLKSIYAKTGCRHQAALLSLVLRSAAMLTTPKPAPHPRDWADRIARLGIAGRHGPTEESSVRTASAADTDASEPLHTTTLLRDPPR